MGIRVLEMFARRQLTVFVLFSARFDDTFDVGGDWEIGSR